MSKWKRSAPGRWTPARTSFVAMERPRLEGARVAGRVVGVHALVATEVRALDGRPGDSLRLWTSPPPKTAPARLSFCRALVARGLCRRRSGHAPMARAGLVAAIGATLPGAAWQRCRTHYAANLMARKRLKNSWPWCAHAAVTWSTTNPTPPRCTTSSTASWTPWATNCPLSWTASTKPARTPSGVHRVPEAVVAADLVQQPSPRSRATARSVAAPTFVGIFPDRKHWIRLRTTSRPSSRPSPLNEIDSARPSDLGLEIGRIAEGPLTAHRVAEEVADTDLKALSASSHQRITRHDATPREWTSTSSRMTRRAC